MGKRVGLLLEVHAASHRRIYPAVTILEMGWLDFLEVHAASHRRIYPAVTILEMGWLDFS